MKKVVIFGGGTGMSQILKGLKLFPVDITAVVTVSDDGRSTGALREIYNMPAVGDISKVLMAAGNIPEEVASLLNYRVKNTNAGSNYDHSIKNLILTALVDQYGSLDAAIPYFLKIFNIKASALPLTEENVQLIAKMHDGEEIIGEAKITAAMKSIDSIRYNKKPKPNPRIFKAIEKADLIIIAPGSLYTSIIPHFMITKVARAIKNSRAKKLYICNLVTQPGETSDFAASDHLTILNKYLGKKTLNAIIVNNAKISKTLIEKYETDEQKYQVIFDDAKLEKMKVKAIAEKIYKIEGGTIRHDSLKVAYLIYSYLIGDR